MSISSPSPAPARKPKPVPERFQVAKTTLWFDRIMTKTIIGGGFTVIVAVFGILFFLLAVTIPLFQGADVKEGQSLAPAPQATGTWGLDPSGTQPFVYQQRQERFLSGQGFRQSEPHARCAAGPMKPSAPTPTIHSCQPILSPRNPAR